MIVEFTPINGLTVNNITIMRSSLQELGVRNVWNFVRFFLDLALLLRDIQNPQEMPDFVQVLSYGYSGYRYPIQKLQTFSQRSFIFERTTISAKVHHFYDQ